MTTTASTETAPTATPARLRVLIVTKLFPNRLEPHACAFNRQQFSRLAERCDVEVLAVIPHLAGASLLGDRTRPGRLSRLPARDVVSGLSVAHPRAPYVPGGGPWLAPLNAPLYLAALLPYVRSLRGRFDVVLGACLYPDAVAAGWFAKLLGLPFAVKAHGTDTNIVSHWRSIEPLLRGALSRAAAVVAVSRPIRTRLLELGARPDRTRVVPNGVDRDVFRPHDRRAARRALGLPEDARVVTYVGRLVVDKGLRELIDAFAEVARQRGTQNAAAHLVLVGEGPLKEELAQRALRHEALAPGGSGLVLLVGEHRLDDVATFVAASDLVVLPSWAEGTPNVLLEALAAGRPVVATNVGGVPDIIRHGETGLLVGPHNPGALARAIAHALERSWDEATLVAAAPPSWTESARDLERALAAATEHDPNPA
jgi:glycosyltransferase involved in cell wall biosynthesis